MESYKFIFLIVVLIIILCTLIYYKILDDKYINHYESFVDHSEYPKPKILADCVAGWGLEFKGKNPTDNRTINEICMNDAYLTNPKLLCGICGTDSSPLYATVSSENPDKRYYGCAPDTNNPLSLNWGDHGTVINKLLSDRLTCDTFNVNASSGMYIYVASDDTCTITINDKVFNHNSINMGEYYIDNVKSGDNLVIKCNNNTGEGGLCFSYIWNKQIFILENNGYQNCANTINYTTEGLIKWDNIWKDQSKNILPWMKTWMRCADGKNSGVKVDTFIGSTKNAGLMNNDCVIFGSVSFDPKITYTNNIENDIPSDICVMGLINNDIKLNNNRLFIKSNMKKNFTNNFHYEFNIKNVMEGNSFTFGGLIINTKNKDIRPLLHPDNIIVTTLNYSLSYIWCGKIFNLIQGNNFDKVAEPILIKGLNRTFNSDNCTIDIKYDLIDRDLNNNKFLFFQQKLLHPSFDSSQKSQDIPLYNFTINNTKSQQSCQEIYDTSNKTLMESMRD